jgi:hypothetical protein
MGRHHTRVAQDDALWRGAVSAFWRDPAHFDSSNTLPQTAGCKAQLKQGSSPFYDT